jgi:cyclopropane-fatty-acyl-phospholipid synthase
MSFTSSLIGSAERVPLPDLAIRAAIARLCSRTAARLAAGNAESRYPAPRYVPRMQRSS